MTALEPSLRRLVADFDAIGAHWALVGGLAVSARAEPRSTRDVDVVIAVATDAAAEALVFALRQRGYRDVGQVVESEIVAAATPVDVIPGARLPVAVLGHLLAMKVLAGRLQDVADFASLFRRASENDLAVAPDALALVVARGTHRQKNLTEEFDRLSRLAEAER